GGGGETTDTNRRGGGGGGTPVVGGARAPPPPPANRGADTTPAARLPAAFARIARKETFPQRSTSKQNKAAAAFKDFWLLRERCCDAMACQQLGGGARDRDLALCVGFRSCAYQTAR